MRPDEAIDAAVIERLRIQIGGDLGVLVRLITTYREEAVKLVGSAAEAAANGDRDGLRRICHRLCGSSAMMGARGIANATTGIGAAIRAGDWPAACASVVELPRLLERTLDAMPRV